MEKIIPITDLQRQTGQIVSAVKDSGESVVITQRGRAAAVLISAEQYYKMQEDLMKLDELELLDMVERARQDVAEGRTVSHQEVWARFAKQARPSGRKKNR